MVEYFEKQIQFWEAFKNPEYLYLLYGGAIRGGKTYVGFGIILAMCRMFPGSRWAVVRKDLPTLRRNTLPVYEKIAPYPFVSPINRTTWEVQCRNGSQILFMPESIKQDLELNRFRGLEVNGFFLEEINELQEKTFFRCMERTGQWQVPGLKTQPPAKIIATCNPSHGWVKTRWHDPWEKGTLLAPYYYLPARADDNPYISESTKKAWKNLPENEYLRFVVGDWNYSGNPKQLILHEWIDKCLETPEENGDVRMGVDIAREGDDETVFAIMRGNTLEHIESYKHIYTDEIADKIEEKILTYPVSANNVKVDSVSVGGGVVDILRKKGLYVYQYIGGAAATKDYGILRYKNVRAQAYWGLREKIRRGEIRFKVMPEKLRADLTSITYDTTDSVIFMAKKENIKLLTGRSTDYSDALVMADYNPRLEWSISVGGELREDN